MPSAIQILVSPQTRATNGHYRPSCLTRNAWAIQFRSRRTRPQRTDPWLWLEESAASENIFVSDLWCWTRVSCSFIHSFSHPHQHVRPRLLLISSYPSASQWGWASGRDAGGCSCVAKRSWMEPNWNRIFHIVFGHFLREINGKFVKQMS